MIGVLFQAIKEIEAKTLIRFKMLSNETDGISINPHAGCTSPVGRQGGIQSLSLAYDENGRCDSMATVMHEFLHALGVSHTQTRPDRDYYVTILKENINATNYHNFDMVDYQYRHRTQYSVLVIAENFNSCVVFFLRGAAPFGRFLPRNLELRPGRLNYETESLDGFPRLPNNH